MTGIRDQGSGIRGLHRLATVISAGLLAACAGTPPPPDWKMNAQSALESYEKRYLDGDSRLAEVNFERARAEIARTGRPDLAARAGLIRCATETAALVREHCAVLATLPAETAAEDKAYAAFLTGQWNQLDPGLVPAAYRPLLLAKADPDRAQALQAIQPPLSRLIAAGVLFQQGRLPPTGITLAVATASEQGWRRPLLAWLNLQLKRAEAAGDTTAATALRQRIELVQSSLPRSAQ
jgi:hypothetical protein